MKQKPSKEFDEKEVDKLIENFHKKPTREVRDRLNIALSDQRQQFLAKEQDRDAPEKSKERER